MAYITRTVHAGANECHRLVRVLYKYKSAIQKPPSGFSSGKLSIKLRRYYSVKETYHTILLSVGFPVQTVECLHDKPSCFGVNVKVVGNANKIQIPLPVKFGIMKEIATRT